MNHAALGTAAVPRLRPRIHHLMGVAATLWSLAGCGASASERHAPQIDTLAGGVIRVANTGPTMWADTNGWKLILERTIAPPEGAGELARPWSLAADSSGMVYVMDMRPNQVKVLRPDGSLRQLIGREGDGPAEYRPGAIIHLVGDTLIVHDPANGRMVRFNLQGSPLGEWSAPDSRRGASPTRHDGAIPAEIILRDQAPSTTAYFARRGFVYYRADGTAIDTVRAPAEPKPTMWELRDGKNDFGTFVPFAPSQEQTLTQAGTLIWGNQQRYELIVSRTGADTVRIITAPGTAAPIPDSLRQSEFKAAVAREAWIATKGRLSDIPTAYPLWTTLATDKLDNLWVQRGKDGGYIADVFSPDGILLGSVPTPFEFDSRDYWTATHLYHVHRDESGIPVIQVYRIRRTTPADTF